MNRACRPIGIFSWSIGLATLRKPSKVIGFPDSFLANAANFKIDGLSPVTSTATTTDLSGHFDCIDQRRHPPLLSPNVRELQPLPRPIRLALPATTVCPG